MAFLRKKRLFALLIIFTGSLYITLRSTLFISNAQKIIIEQKLINSMEMKNLLYPLTFSKDKMNISLIFSSWRCGSTFLGDIFQSPPGTYYHFEPFDYLGVTQQNTTEHKNAMIEHVKNLLNCNFSTTTGRKHINVTIHWRHNRHLAKYCSNEEDLCHDIDFQSAFCKIFPRQSVKFVRARISLAETFLEDPAFQTNVILLVRDPRAVSVSRKELWLCDENLPCSSMKRYCGDLMEDYKTVQLLVKKFPNRVKILRFENLAIAPIATTKDIFEQFEWEFDDRIKEFLEQHTTVKKGDMFDTFRVSEVVARQWMKNVTMKEVENIQGVCQEAMELWGYNLVQDDEQLEANDFDPVGQFFI